MKLLRRRHQEKRATSGQIAFLDRQIDTIRHPEVRAQFRAYATFRIWDAPPTELTAAQMSDLIMRFAVLIDYYRTNGVVPTEVMEW
jgi:hypothetical protein